MLTSSANYQVLKVGYMCRGKGTLTYFVIHWGKSSGLDKVCTVRHILFHEVAHSLTFTWITVTWQDWLAHFLQIGLEFLLYQGQKHWFWLMQCRDSKVLSTHWHFKSEKNEWSCAESILNWNPVGKRHYREWKKSSVWKPLDSKALFHSIPLKKGGSLWVLWIVSGSSCLERFYLEHFMLIYLF